LDFGPTHFGPGNFCKQAKKKDRESGLSAMS
jgi:hypothetical protein